MGCALRLCLVRLSCWWASFICLGDGDSQHLWAAGCDLTEDPRWWITVAASQENGSIGLLARKILIYRWFLLETQTRYQVAGRRLYGQITAFLPFLCLLPSPEEPWENKATNQTAPKEAGGGVSLFSP